jgi:hypothetical protein
VYMLRIVTVVRVHVVYCDSGMREKCLKITVIIGWMNLAGKLIGIGENKCKQNFIL